MNNPTAYALLRVVSTVGAGLTLVACASTGQPVPSLPPARSAAAAETTLLVAPRPNSGHHAAQSFATITSALLHALPILRTGGAVRVAITPGTYRETLPVIDGSAESDAFRAAPLTIEGLGDGVVISGSDVLTDWSAVPGHPGIYQHLWDRDLGFADGRFGANNPKGLLAHRREMLFIDGRPLLPVILEQHDYAAGAETGTWQYRKTLPPSALGDGELMSDLRYAGYSGPGATPLGTFAVAERRDLIYVRPAPGVDLRRARVEAAVRPTLLRLWSKQNVKLRRLTFQHAASTAELWDNPTHAAVIIGKEDPAAEPFYQWPTKNIELEHVTIRANSNTGLSTLLTSGLHITASDFSFNGGNGVSGAYLRDSRWNGMVTSHNNWRSHLLGGGYGWAAAGVKFWCSRDNVFNRIEATYNAHGGFWTDGANLNNVITDSNFSHNAVFGVWIEISPGPTTITRSTMSHNGWRGLQATHSAYIRAERNQIFDNGLAPVGQATNDPFVLGRAQVYLGHGHSRDYQYFPPDFLSPQFAVAGDPSTMRAHLEAVELVGNQIYISQGKSAGDEVKLLVVDGERSAVSERSNVYTPPP